MIFGLWQQSGLVASLLERSRSAAARDLCQTLEADRRVVRHQGKTRGGMAWCVATYQSPMAVLQVELHERAPGTRRATRTGRLSLSPPRRASHPYLWIAELETATSVQAGRRRETLLLQEAMAMACRAGYAGIECGLPAQGDPEMHALVYRDAGFAIDRFDAPRPILASGRDAFAGHAAWRA